MLHTNCPMCPLQSLCEHHDEENTFKVESIKPYLNDFKISF